jgi:hypothetical protein
MAKKNFTGGLNSLLQNTKNAEPEEKISAKDESKNKPGRPKTSTKTITKTSEIGTKEGETRATFIVREEVLEKIFAIAYWEREQKKDIIDNALSEFIFRYEKKNGSIQPIPIKRQ